MPPSSSNTALAATRYPQAQDHNSPMGADPFENYPDAWSNSLDGKLGSNRAVQGKAQIAADNDVDAIKAWLARFMDSPNTFSSYRKEAERLLLWATLARKKAISSLTHEDLLAYQQFLSDPQPAEQWVITSGRKPARSDPDWRPFAGPLSPSSRRQSMVILNSMFAWLVTAGYLAGNPLSLARQRRTRASSRLTRYLDDHSWAEVRRTIEELPRETPREREHYLRLRWLFSLLYLCGLRVSELTSNTMGDFFCRRDADGVERWWLDILGKGEKRRLVPATRELMIELSRYRQEKGLAPFPLPGETTPLVLPLSKQERALTRAGIHAIVKKVFRDTAARIRTQGEHGEHQARLLEQASTHWLRHTAGSHMANQQIDLRHVRDTLGHESLTTTNLYLHVGDDTRHREIEELHKLDWTSAT